MQKLNYFMILLLLSIPLLAGFSTPFFSRTISLLWGFLGWLIVVNLWADRKEPNDTLLQQHNKEAEEMEAVEKIKKVMEEPEFKNPFAK